MRLRGGLVCFGVPGAAPAGAAAAHITLQQRCFSAGASSAGAVSLRRGGSPVPPAGAGTGVGAGGEAGFPATGCSWGRGCSSERGRWSLAAARCRLRSARVWWVFSRAGSVAVTTTPSSVFLEQRAMPLRCGGSSGGSADVNPAGTCQSRGGGGGEKKREQRVTALAMLWLGLGGGRTLSQIPGDSRPSGGGAQRPSAGPRPRCRGARRVARRWLRAHVPSGKGWCAPRR